MPLLGVRLAGSKIPNRPLTRLPTIRVPRQTGRDVSPPHRQRPVNLFEPIPGHAPPGPDVASNDGCSSPATTGSDPKRWSARFASAVVPPSPKGPATKGGSGPTPWIVDRSRPTGRKSPTRNRMPTVGGRPAWAARSRENGPASREPPEGHFAAPDRESATRRTGSPSAPGHDTEPRPNSAADDPPQYQPDQYPPGPKHSIRRKSPRAARPPARPSPIRPPGRRLAPPPARPRPPSGRGRGTSEGRTASSRPKIVVSGGPWLISHH